MLFLKRTEADPMGTSIQPGSPISWDEDSYRTSSGIPRLAPIPPRTCASQQCATTWTAPWRSRKRPIFEDQWGCSGRCVLEIVRAAVRRESASQMTNASMQHNHRMPLGLLLLAQGWITHPQLQYALDVQRQQGGRIGEVLVAECGIEADKITRGLSLQWSCPVLNANGFSPREMALVAPKIFVEQWGALPLRVAGSRILYLGFEDRLDATVAFALEQMTGLKVESGLMKTEEYLASRIALLGSNGVELREEACGETDAMAAKITALLEQKQPVASKLVRVHHRYWLRFWLETGTKGHHGTLPLHGEDMLDYVFTIEQ